MATSDTRIWRANFVPAQKRSKYELRISEEEFRDRLKDTVFDRKVNCVDAYGQSNVLHICIHRHAVRNFRDRAVSNCYLLIVDWLKDALRYPEILEEILISDDCDKFMILDRAWQRIITFSVLPEHDEYLILMQSVFFLAQNNHEKFYVGSRDIKCFSIGMGKDLISGADNIDEMVVVQSQPE